MSLVAVTAANAAPAPAQAPPHEAADRGAGSKFADLLNTLENETAKVEPSPKIVSADPTSAASSATSGGATKASRLAALEAALAGLAKDTLGGGAKAAPPSPTASSKATADGASDHAAKPRATPKIDATRVAPSSTDAGGAASAAASATGEKTVIPKAASKGSADDVKTDSAATADSIDATMTTLAASNSGAPVVAAFLSAAPAPAPMPPASAAAATAAPRGQTSAAGDSLPETTSTVSDAALAKGAAADSATSSLRDILGGDSSLSISNVESRTYLGLDIASSAVTTAAVAAATEIGVAPRAASAPSTPANESASPSAKRASAPGGAPAHPAAASAGAGASVAPVAGKPSSAKSGDSSSGGDPSGSAAPPPAATTSAAATSAASDLVGGLSASVSLDRLPAVIAEAAEELSAAAQSASGASAAAGAAKAQPVKELQINLAPAELGSLQVTMRLAGGKLSIVVEVAKTSTLQAIAGDRDAIVARLGAASTPLDSLVVQPMRADATAGADSRGDAQSGNQDNPYHGANRDSLAGGQSTSQRDGAADAWRRQSASTRRGAGDLTV
jgi:hypothetical protein